MKIGLARTESKKFCDSTYRIQIKFQIMNTDFFLQNISMIQIRGIVFIKTKIFKVRVITKYHFYKNGMEYMHEGCKKEYTVCFFFYFRWF